MEEEIEEKSCEISRLFNRLHGLVLEMKNFLGLTTGSKLLKNILQSQYREISQLSERLRGYQKSFLNKLTDREKYAEQFVINFDEIDLEESNKYPFMTHRDPNHVNFESNGSDIAVGFNNQGYNQFQEQINHNQFQERTGFNQLQEQIVGVDGDIDLLRERDAEMSHIMRSVIELNAIFQEMNSLVVNQGSLLDRIDYNLETVQIKVEEGAIQLSRAERSARSARKIKCIMAGIGTIFIALLIFIIES